ncbi:pyruvate carboxyltransferase [Pseudomonas sp. TCU-HL1]|uniref:pyruvate carboxyltransferase n=1 Tax=Pseudomonas sp. TCU-HL1 TaxID=1856685 RepID=UPI0008572C7D|nr:pyruvate carboxyltransferase [Pseudomonas sp. TCU-HL1]AOE83957.1 hypothetical protein THL1_1409 [Pseudomonas sp. TCU-HL1]
MDVIIEKKYTDFMIPHLVDETLREGVERTAFPISVESKVDILRSMIDAGIRDFVVGCGPESPDVWRSLHEARDSGEISQDVESTFIVLLNCWETAYRNLSKYKGSQWIADTVFSFGMITYKEKENTFERAVQAFKELGTKKFKASVLNNFRRGVSESGYREICRQINWARDLGAGIIRINDSVGSLQPNTTEWLCSNLVRDYPDLIFCLHAHNDNGLAVANAMISIQCGFQMIEGALAGYGNRSGIAPIEQIVKLCHVNNISLGKNVVDIDKLIAAARLCEEKLLQVPSVYRPVGEIFETDSNLGVLNIPDFLDTRDDKRYFVNYVGLHPDTVKMAIRRHYPESDISAVSTQKLWQVVSKIQEEMSESFHETEQRYKTARRQFMEFYKDCVYTSRNLANSAKEMLGV